MATRFLFHTTPEKGLANELSLTALRVFTGLSMALGHGLSKMPPSGKFIEGVGALGFPAPQAFAWLAAGSELLGGFLLAAGLLTRPSAALIAVTMAVAAFGRHASDPYKLKELALLYLAAAVVFAVRGAGKLSLDYLIGGRR